MPERIEVPSVASTPTTARVFFFLIDFFYYRHCRRFGSHPLLPPLLLFYTTDLLELVMNSTALMFVLELHFPLSSSVFTEFFLSRASPDEILVR